MDLPLEPQNIVLASLAPHVPHVRRMAFTRQLRSTRQEEAAQELKEPNDFPKEQRSRWLPAETMVALKSHQSIARYRDRGVELPPEALFCWTDGDFEMYVEPWPC